MVDLLRQIFPLQAVILRYIKKQSTAIFISICSNPLTTYIVMGEHMRIAIISDIHGHGLALETALSAIRKESPDQIVCLGDAIQGGPQPSEVVAILRDLGCPVVMGNADAWLLTGIETGNEDISPERRVRLDETRLWSLSQLTEKDLAFIATFQPTVTVALSGGQNLLGFHGSPTSFDEVILPTIAEDELQKILVGLSLQVGS
jgi:hypothetical protein